MNIRDWFQGAKQRTIEEKPEDRIDPKELERIIMNAGLGRTLNLIGSTPRVLWRQFLSGIVWGIGYFLGFTVGIAILLWFMTQFVDFPVVGEYAQKLVDIIDNYSPVQ